MTELEVLVTEIAMRATYKACKGMHPTRIEAVAVPLAQALVDVVIGNEEGKQQNGKKHYVEVPNYIIFELWNRILDEVEKEIPAANQIEVSGICTRSGRRELELPPKEGALESGVKKFHTIMQYGRGFGCRCGRVYDYCQSRREAEIRHRTHVAAALECRESSSEGKDRYKDD